MLPTTKSMPVTGARPGSKRRKGDLTRAEKVTRITKLKGSPCSDCGQVYPSYVMDFDHVRGIKRENISSMLNYAYSWKDVVTELAKCDLVCSNCHRERTHQRYMVGN